MGMPMLLRTQHLRITSTNSEILFLTTKVLVTTTIKSESIHGGKGTAASGLDTAECACHEMKHPMAVGDLQKWKQ